MPTKLRFVFLLSVFWLTAVDLPSVRGAKPPLTALAFSPDGKFVLCGSQAGLEIRSWPKLNRLRRLPTQLVQIHDVKFAPNGRFLLAAGGSPGENGTAELFSWPQGKRLLRTAGHRDVIYAVAWRPDSSGWATASLDRTVRFYNVAGNQPVRTITGHSRGVKAIGFLPDGKILVTSGIDQSVRVWKADDGKAVRSFDNHTRAVHDLAVRPQKPGGGLPMVVTVSDDRTIRLWQPTIGRMVRFARLKGTVPLAVRWTRDGKRIVTVCSDGHLRVIDPDSVQVMHNVKVLSGWAYSLDVHPQENTAVVGGKNGVVSRVVLP